MLRGKPLLRSVTLKMLLVYLAGWLSTMAVLGFMLGTLYRQERTEQRFLEMESQGKAILQLFSQGDRSALEQMEAASRLFGGPVWILDVLDNHFGISLYMNDSSMYTSSSGMHLTDAVREQFFSPALAGETVRETGYFDGQFTRRMLTVALPHSEGGRIIGALFMHADTVAIDQGVGDLYETLGLSMLVSGILGLFITLILASRFSRPLREMGHMAKELAQGRFGHQVQVKGHDDMALLGHAFNEMSRNLEHTDTLRVGFVANVSHELRSPLTSVQGYIQGMRDEVIPPDAYGECLNIVYDETVRMSKLINDLLDLSRMDSDQFHLHTLRFNINELIRRTIIALHSQIDQKGIEVDVNFFQEPCMVLADEDRIRQVMVNLIDNAIKYSHKGGRISLLTQGGGEKITVSIRDEGAGIPQADLPFVFERFYKVEKAHTAGEGTGLGLAITQRIIQQHGQEIRVASQPGQGSVFTFTLPLSKD